MKLEPDAHNNIIVRRMFPNAYGWPVVEHLVKEHFLHDPEGLKGEFIQESEVIPLVGGEEDGRRATSPNWESPILNYESDGEITASSKTESVGRALMSDEEGGYLVEMTEYPVGRGSNAAEDGSKEL